MIQSLVLDRRKLSLKPKHRTANSITESKFVELTVPSSLIALVEVCSWTRLIQLPFRTSATDRH